MSGGEGGTDRGGEILVPLLINHIHNIPWLMCINSEHDWYVHYTQNLTTLTILYVTIYSTIIEAKKHTTIFGRYTVKYI